MKKSLILALALLVSLSMVVTGTIAYLQDTDEDVNVMTLGNVSIAQLEYERIVEDGAWVSTGETDKYGFVPDEIQPFTQCKPLYPAYFADGAVKWDDRLATTRADAEHQQSWADVKGEKVTGAPGSSQLFDDSVVGAVDKFVFVENTGTSDAYVRTWFAFEQGSLSDEDFERLIGTNGDAIHWSWETVATGVEIDGNTYVVAVATYLGPTSNPTGILAPGTITYPSLLQVYMAPEATNDDVIAVDGNANGTYDILVLSQAVQTTNFPDAKTALDAAFGEPAEDTIPWEEVNLPRIIYTVEELRAASREGGSYLLGADLLIDQAQGSGFGTYVSADFKLDLNGHDIELAHDLGKYGYALFYVTGTDAQLEITGNGNLTISDGLYDLVWATNGASVNIYGGNWSETSDDMNATDYCEGIYGNKNATINIYGGTYEWDCYPDDVLNVKNGAGSTIALYGGEFKASADFHLGHNDTSFLADGYEIVESTDANGDVWQTVVAR